MEGFDNLLFVIYCCFEAFGISFYIINGIYFLFRDAHQVLDKMPGTNINVGLICLGLYNVLLYNLQHPIAVMVDAIHLYHRPTKLTSTTFTFHEPIFSTITGLEFLSF